METKGQKLFLIDYDERQIPGANLPSNGQVLSLIL